MSSIAFFWVILQCTSYKVDSKNSEYVLLRYFLDCKVREHNFGIGTEVVKLNFTEEIIRLKKLLGLGVGELAPSRGSLLRSPGWQSQCFLSSDKLET
jgi:hypothetical protein